MATDEEMPDIDGVELCRIMRSQPQHWQHWDLPIVLLSGAPGPDCNPCLWNRFLRNPLRPNDLDAAIRAAIDACASARMPVCADQTLVKGTSRDDQALTLT